MLLKIRAYINRFSAKPSVMIVLLIIIAAIPLAVWMALTSQENRQRASEIPVSPPATTGQVQLELWTSEFVSNPETLLINRDPLNIAVILHAGSYNITGIDFVASSAKTILPITQFTPSTSFNSIVTNNIDVNGNLHFVATATDPSITNSGNISVGTLTVAPQTVGSTTVAFDSSQITALGYASALTVGYVNKNYVVTAPSSTPIPTAIPTSIPAATPTPTPIPGNIDDNPEIDIRDYNIWVSEFLHVLGTKKSDLNHDGIIDLLDFNLWRTAFQGTVATPTANPRFIRITAPNGGEYLNVGQTVSITWTYADVDNCTLGWFAGNDQPTQITQLNPNGGSFPWIVNVGTMADGFSKQVKLNMLCAKSTESDTASDQSDNYFTVTKPAVVSPTPTAIPTPTLVAKRVFVTSTTSYPSTSGSTADGICAAYAQNDHLGGTWKAWLSTTTLSAANKLVHFNGPYKLLNGTTIANNWIDLTDGTLQHEINITDTGSTITDTSIANVWTGTNTDGSAATSTCSNWTSTGGFTNMGSANSQYDSWTQIPTQSCQNGAAFFCFEQ